MSETRKFKIGFIGAGGIALHHMKYLAAMEGVEIAAAADVSPKSLSKAEEMYKIPKLYTDYKQMLKERTDLDAVSVCTPNGLHAPAAIAALEAGKHVLVEKPMAMNVAEGQAMLDAAKKAGKHLVVGFQYRFDAKSFIIRQQIAAGAFGKILFVRCQALRRRGIPNWGVFGRKDLQGGGPLIDIGVHILEMAHYMIGAPRPVAASGSTFTFLGNQPSDVLSMWPNWDYKSYTVEDMAIGQVRFADNAMLHIEASFVAHIPQDVWNVQIMGEMGGAIWDPIQIFKDQEGLMANITPGYVPQWDHFERKMKHFVEVCRDGRKSEASAEDGLAVQKMLDGIYASAEAGREVGIE
ncbi:MAG TPA: Gfo/Idh/MocA family oxidoreductase [Tepidisphaeraceae bacterium]